MLTSVMRSPKHRRNVIATLTIAEIVTALTFLGLCIGGALAGREIVEISRISAQVSQISAFDDSIVSFHEKYNGLPGDLLYVYAERVGLPHGDGTPGHGDGDGKISPCNLGWQWNLGCETALFWAQLSSADFIAENFSADAHLPDSRLQTVGVMAPYLPMSPLGNHIYVAVWNSDGAQPSPGRQLPYGNYYEISRINGINHGKMKDDSNALTPTQALAIDKKMDDGYPLSGRVRVNGNATWPSDAWGAYATPGPEACVDEDHLYNITDLFRAHRPLCHIAIAFTCCERGED